jgi:transcriptional pleiotropic regulator of transition state genes
MSFDMRWQKTSGVYIYFHLCYNMVAVSKNGHEIHAFPKGGVHVKATGIVRDIDSLGRIVVPIAIRKAWNLGEGSPLEIFTDEDMIVLKKYEPGCIFNGTVEDNIEYGGHKVSKAAIRDMAHKIGLV